MKKVLFIALTVLLLIVVLYMLYSYENTAKMKNTNIQQVNKTNARLINSTTHAQNKDSNIDIDYTIKENYPKNKSYSIFEELDIDSVRLDIKPIEDVEPIAAVRMQKNIIQKIKLGDTILLPSIDGSNYELTITNKEVTSRGNVSIDGSFSENGVTYTAILTEGSKAAFISMNTPEGTYEIELLNGIGYVYANSDINNAKIDYSKSDEVQRR